MRRTIVKAALIAAFMCTVSSVAIAGPVSGAFTANTLPANDDGSTGLVTLPFSLDFFGTTYTNLYVNNNGNVTFGTPVGTYTPSGVAGGYSGAPIISPFFADVDTGGVGSGVVTYGGGVYNGFNAWGVEWPGVGYYGEHTDQLNTFELVLADRNDVGANDFDIYFNYDQILWETGDASGGSGGHGGTSAAVGFSNGTGAPGTFYQLPGSLVNGALIDGGPDSLTANTNDGVTGQYLFQVRNGDIVLPPVGNVPEPATWALMVLGFGGLGSALRRRRAAVMA